MVQVFRGARRDWLRACEAVARDADAVLLPLEPCRKVSYSPVSGAVARSAAASRRACDDAHSAAGSTDNDRRGCGTSGDAVATSARVARVPMSVPECVAAALLDTRRVSCLGDGVSRWRVLGSVYGGIVATFLSKA
jgi:hypothetical protein